MPSFYVALTEEHKAWILAQHVFVVASSPLHFGRVNVSPKGYTTSTFTIVDNNNVFYQDATGSGAETIAHVYENKRLTIMFMSFDKVPFILRLWGEANVYEYPSPEYTKILEEHKQERINGGRAIIWLSIKGVQKSCGFGVPLMSFVQERETMETWTNSKTCESEVPLLLYQQKNNYQTVDGLPALKSARRANGEWVILGDIKARIRRIVKGQREGLSVGVLIGAALVCGFHFVKRIV